MALVLRARGTGGAAAEGSAAVTAVLAATPAPEEHVERKLEVALSKLKLLDTKALLHNTRPQNRSAPCLLVWELLTAVGTPDYDAYATWESGRCAAIDAPQEQRVIREALEAEYGTLTLNSLRGLNFGGKRGPIGKISESEKVLERLTKQVLPAFFSHLPPEFVRFCNPRFIQNILKSEGSGNHLGSKLRGLGAILAPGSG